MVIENKIIELERAIELLQKPTPKRLRQAADILLIIAYSEREGFCEPALFKVTKFENIDLADNPVVTLKKFICAICPSCRGFTFDLNTEIMQGSCLSCSFKSTNYKSDMVSMRPKTKKIKL